MKSFTFLTEKLWLQSVEIILALSSLLVIVTCTLKTLYRLVTHLLSFKNTAAMIIWTSHSQFIVLSTSFICQIRNNDQINSLLKSKDSVLHKIIFPLPPMHIYINKTIKSPYLTHVVLTHFYESLTNFLKIFLAKWEQNFFTKMIHLLIRRYMEVTIRGWCS